MDSLGSIGQPAKHQGGTREAGKDHWDSPGGRRGSIGQPEAPGRQERINWTACEAPGRHQAGRKGPIGTRRQERTNRHQGGIREAGKDH